MSKLFTYKDIARIIDALSDEEAMRGPQAVRYVKDVLLTRHWPAVIKEFYPDTYTLEDALREAHLLHFFQSIWSEQWINVLFNILEGIGVDKSILESVKLILLDSIRYLFMQVLNF